MKESLSKTCFLLGIILLSVNTTVEAQTSPYSKPRTYPQYQSPYNMDLIYGVMKYKQDAFNKNWAYIQPKLQDLNALIAVLNEGEIELSNNQRNWINKQLDWIHQNMNDIDFSNNTNTANVGQWLDDVIKTIYTWAKESLERESKRSNINDTNVRSQNNIPEFGYNGERIPSSATRIYPERAKIPIKSTQDHSGKTLAYVSGYVYVIRKNESFSYVERNGIKGYISNVWFKK